MANYINSLQYDSSTVYTNGFIYYFSVGILASSNGPAEDEILRSENAVEYQLSNNGSFYAGAEYFVYQGDGHTITVLSDNAAGSNWWNSWTTVSDSSHAASGGSQSDSESTIYGKDGYIYVSDADSSGNTIASAVFSQANGAIVSSNNWSNNAIVDNNFTNGPDRTGTPGLSYGAVYSSVNETDYGNPGAGPNPNPNVVSATSSTQVSATTSTQTVDLSKITATELQSDFTSPAQLSQNVVSRSGAVPMVSFGYSDLATVSTQTVVGHHTTPSHSSPNDFLFGHLTHAN